MPSPANSSPPAFRPSMRDTLQSVTSPNHDQPARCAYPSKPCPNARAVKLNGDTHNFCEFHRRKANMNQRRWQQRRRRMRHIGGQSPTSSQGVSPRDELESAEAVMMLQQTGDGRYSPVPAHAWPRYSPSSVEWAPRAASVATVPIMHVPFRPASVNVLESTLPRATLYTQQHSHHHHHQQVPTSTMIPPLRSLPLPKLLPSVFASSKTSPRAASASVYTC